MRVLVIGSGGREHALVWKLAQSPETSVFAAPGNPGMAGIAACLPVKGADPAQLLAAAEMIDADLTVVGPEVPLVAGVVDAFRAAGRRIVGPNREAAQLEGSKVFCKNFFVQRNIPTAAFVTVENETDARRALDRFGFPVVLKADGLAAGKGVVRSEEHTSELQSLRHLVCRLLLEKKKHKCTTPLGRVYAACAWLSVHEGVCL